MPTLEEMGLFDPQEPRDTAPVSLEDLGLYAPEPTQPPAEQPGGAGVLDFFRTLVGPSRGPLTQPGEDEAFESAREKVFADMGVEHERPEPVPVSDGELGVADRVARRRLQRELNPTADPERGQEIDQSLADHIQQREAARDEELEQLGDQVTVFGVPLKDSIVGEGAPMPVRRAFAAAANTGAAIENTARRVFGFSAAAEETRNALNVLSRYNQRVDEDSLLGRTMGPIAGNIQESLVQGSLAAPGGLVAVSGMFGLDQMDRAMTDAANQGLSGYEQAKTGVANFLIGGGLTYAFGAFAKSRGLDPGDSMFPAYTRAMNSVSNMSGAGRAAAGALVNSGEEGLQEALTAWEEVRSGTNPQGADDLFNRVLQAAGAGAISGTVAPSVGALKQQLTRAQQATASVKGAFPDVVSAVDDVQRSFGSDADLTDKSPEYQAAYAAESEALTRLKETLELGNPTGESRQQVADRRAAAEYVRETLDGMPAEDKAAAEKALAEEEAELSQAEAYFADLDARVAGRGDVGARAFLEAEAESRLGRVEEPTEVDPSLDTELTRTEAGYILPPRTENIARQVATGALAGAIAGGSAGMAVLGAGAGAGISLAAALSPRFEMTRTMTKSLQAAAQQLSDAKRGPATDVAVELSRRGKRVAAATQEYLGRMSEVRNRVMQTLTPGAEFGAGKLTLAQAVRVGQEAKQEAGFVEVSGGIRAGKYAATAYLEGTKPLSSASPEMQNWVKAQREAHQAMAAVSTDELKIRQQTPLAKREARRAELQALPLSDLQSLHSELFPDRPVPDDQGKLLDAVTNTRFFTPFPEGKVALRMPTDHLRNILTKGPAHPLYGPLMESVSQANGIELELAQSAMAPMEGASNAPKIASEVPRIFEWFPDYIDGPNGRVDLLVRNPQEYSSKAFNAFASSSARVREFGQDIMQEDGVGVLSKLRDKAIAEGLPADLVDTVHDTIAGLGPERGVEPTDSFEPLSAVANLVRSNLLSGSFVAQLPDIIATQLTHGRGDRARLTLQSALPRALTSAEYRDALVHAERIGTYVRSYEDWTYRPDQAADSLSRMFGNSVLSLTRTAWDAEARAAGVLGYQVAKDLQAGRGTEADRHLLEDIAGYTKEQADRLIRRQGVTVGDYHEAARRVASNVTMTDLTPNISKAAIESSPLWRKLMWFSSYPLYRAKVTETKVNRLIDGGRAFAAKPSYETAAEAAKGVKQFLRYAGYTTAGGAAQIALRNMLFNFGIEEGLGVTWDEATEDPLEFAGQAFRAGMMGPVIDSIIWSAERDGTVDLTAVAPVASIFKEFGDALNPNTQNYNYADKSGVERFATLAQRYALPTRLGQAVQRITEIDALGPLVYPVGLGQEDEEFRASRKRFYDFLEEKGKPSVSFVPSSEESPADKQFRRRMREFMDYLDNEEDTPQRGVKMQEALFRAMEVKTEGGQVLRDRASMARSLQSRRLIPRIPEEYRAEFAQQYPEDHRRIRAFDELLTGWADYIKE